MKRKAEMTIIIALIRMDYTFITDNNNKIAETKIPVS